MGYTPNNRTKTVDSLTMGASRSKQNKKEDLEETDRFCIAETEKDTDEDIFKLDGFDRIINGPQRRESKEESSDEDEEDSSETPSQIRHALDESEDDKYIAIESEATAVEFITKTERKRIEKREIREWLARKGLSDDEIDGAYAKYFEQEGLCEITFSERPLGFTLTSASAGT